MITSTSNTKVKRLVNLRKKSKLRDMEKVFLTEGIRMFREVPKDRVSEIYASRSFLEKEGALLKEMAALGIRIEILADPVFGYVSDTKTPQGILCVVRRIEKKLGEISGGKNPLLLILDNIQDPGNLGTIIRTAEAAGITGVIMSADCVDIYNPKTIRSTMGSIYRVPFFYTEDICDTIRVLQNNEIHVYAAELNGEKFYDEYDYHGGTAFLVGNEGNGLREETAACADARISIPMEGNVESLNAATASTVLFYEAYRQRRRS